MLLNKICFKNGITIKSACEPLRKIILSFQRRIQVGIVENYDKISNLHNKINVKVIKVE